jgi:hypothetical protein
MNPLYLSVVEIESFSLADGTDIYLFVLHRKVIDLMLI